MRQLLMHKTAGGPVLARLEQDDTVWAQAYAAVMATPAGRPMHAFWRHYYGASAEMRFAGAELARLREDVDALLAGGTPLAPPARSFLDDLRQLCVRAEQAHAFIDVIAD